ncbi:MAG: hypothetical protein IAE79_13785 [Anaerolinea sp.]|nr:hypothetical protein [Anaerolinea sp.]
MNTTMQRELRINQAIDEQLNSILKQMQALLETSRIWESKMEVGQVQNLLAVAQETDSVEVVKNFIRYQIGRDTTGSSWRRRVGTGPVFGEQIITELDKLEGIARTLVAQDAVDLEIDRTWMKMTRLYLGYLRRYFYYKKRGAE